MAGRFIDNPILGATPARHLAARCYTSAMPTKKPRIFLTLTEKDEAALAVLTVKWNCSKLDAIRRALREAGEKST